MGYRNISYSDLSERRAKKKSEKKVFITIGDLIDSLMIGAIFGGVVVLAMSFPATRMLVQNVIAMLN